MCIGANEGANLQIAQLTAVNLAVNLAVMQLQAITRLLV